MDVLAVLGLMLCADLFFESAIWLIKSLTAPKQRFTKMPDGDYYFGISSAEIDANHYKEEDEYR